MHDGRGEVDLAGCAVEAGTDAAARLDAVDLLQEVDVKVGAPEFAVRDPLQAEVLLKSDDLTDRAVFDVAQLRLGDSAFLVPLACIEKLLRPQEAADVICSKRGRAALCHRGRGVYCTWLER